MYKIIIVDDERQMRSAMIDTIPWIDVDCEVTQEADNGFEALKMMGQDMPDIALIDLEMPVMDGLELIREIRRRSWKVEVIILTCHADFEYAQEAIRLNVFDYALKISLSPDYMLGMLRRLLINRIERQGGPKMTELKRVKNNAGYMVAMLIDSPPDGLRGAFEAYNALADNWNDIISQGRNAELFYLEGNEGIGCRISQCEVETFAQNLMDCIHLNTGYDLSLGISDYTDDCGIKQMEQAVMRAQHAFYSGVNQIFVDEKEDDQWNNGSELLSPVELLMTEDNQNIRTLVYAAIPQLRGRRPELVRSAVVEWIYTLSMRSKRQGQSLAEPLTDLKQISRHVRKYQTFDELANECLRAVDALTDQQTRSKLSEVVRMSVEILQKNLKYSESLMQIARQVGCSYCYLSSQFKLEIGMGFTEYRNRLRVEYAKQMLKKTDKDLGEIAEELGFSSSYYLSTTFKKLTGTSPAAYRVGQE